MINLDDFRENVQIIDLNAEEGSRSRCIFYYQEQIFSLELDYIQIDIGKEIHTDLIPHFIEHKGNPEVERTCIFCNKDIQEEEKCTELFQIKYLDILIEKLMDFLTDEEEMAEEDFDEMTIELVNKIYNLSGNKKVTIVESEDEDGAYMFTLSDDGEVELLGVDDLEEDEEFDKIDVLYTVDEVMEKGGAMIIRQSTDIFLNGINITNVYGVVLENGYYIGLDKVQVRAMCCTDEYGNPTKPEPGIVFCDFN